MSNFQFLCVTVADDLSWRTNITFAVGETQQLFYLRKGQNFNRD